MKFYYYWFYTIYNIYYELSRDVYFYLYANAMFSFVFFCTANWIFNGINLLVSNNIILFRSKYYLPGLAVLVYITNHFLFITNNKHQVQFEKYKLNRNKRKDTIVIAFSVLSVLLFFVCIFLVRAKY